MISEEVLKKEIKSFVKEVKSSQSLMSISEGQTLTLRANIPGAFCIRWILNGMELSNSEQYRYGVSGNDQTLTIRCVSQHEQGTITCQAETEQGPVQCHFSTKVTAKHSEAPHFLVQPKSQNVTEGQKVTFTCEITGEPSPEVEWLKDNLLVSIFVSLMLFFYQSKLSFVDVINTQLVLQISVTPNIRLSRSKNVYTLEIYEATVADIGKYTMTARNQFGTCSATSSLNVFSKLTLVFY